MIFCLCGISVFVEEFDGFILCCVVRFALCVVCGFACYMSGFFFGLMFHDRVG